MREKALRMIPRREEILDAVTSLKALGATLSVEEGDVPPLQRVQAEVNFRDEDKDRATEVRLRLRVLKHELGERWIEVAELLLEARKKGYAKSWKYLTLDEYVDKEFGISGRSGRYLVETYEKFVLELECDHAALQRIGWTKAQKMIPAVNEANLGTWIEYAATHTVKDVEMRVLQEIGDEGKEAHSIRSMWGGLLDPGQADVSNRAIERTKREIGSNNFGDALEACMAEVLSRDELPRYEIVKALVDSLLPYFRNPLPAERIGDVVVLPADQYEKIRRCLVQACAVLYPDSVRPEEGRNDQPGPPAQAWDDTDQGWDDVDEIDVLPEEG